MLVLSIGYKATAEKTGVKYATLRQWAKRGKWFQKPVHPFAVTHVTRPVDALASELETLGKQTKLSFAKYSHKVAKDSEKATLRDSPYVHKAIQGAAIVHGWNQPNETKQNILNLGILIGKTDLPDASNNKVTDV